MRMDEQELVARIKKGDEVAFAKIMDIYKNKIVNFLYQLTGDYEKAVELSQETFVRVYFKAHKYKPIAPFSCWIFAIASNLAKTELKKRWKHATVSIDSSEPGMEKAISTADPPDSGLEKNLRQALDTLSPIYKLPVILKDVEGYSQEEIAEILNKPVGTIKARISRGRGILKTALEKARSDKSYRVKNEEYSHGRA